MRAAIQQIVAPQPAGTIAGTAEETGPAKSTVIELGGEALLVTSNREAQHWAPRWLKQAGFEVQFANSADEALGLATTSQLSVIIVEMAFRTNSNVSLVEELRDAYGQEVPIIALCDSDTDARAAREFNISDVVRRPFDWDIITRRAAAAVQAHRLLKELRESRQRVQALQN